MYTLNFSCFKSTFRSILEIHLVRKKSSPQVVLHPLRNNESFPNATKASFRPREYLRNEQSESALSTSPVLAMLIITSQHLKIRSHFLRQMMIAHLLSKFDVRSLLAKEFVFQIPECARILPKVVE